MSPKLIAHIQCLECGGSPIIKDTEISEFV